MLAKKRFSYWAQALAVPEQVLANRCRATLPPIAGAVFKDIVLFALISFSTVESGKKNWCYRRTGTNPGEPDHRPSADS